MKNTHIYLIILFTLFFSACESKQSSPKSNNTITVITPNFDKAITGPIKKEIATFEKKTNSKVIIISPSWDDMIDKIEESLTDDRINYDVFVVFSSWGGSLLSKNDAAQIPKEVQDLIEWDDILPIYKNNVLSWNNKYYFLPYDGDCINLYYRKDILNNKVYKEDFYKEFGYELNVPKTWKEYEDIAKFFNGWDWDNDGKIEYGFAESRIKGYGTIFGFFTRAASYAKHPEDKAFYFDEEMNAKINSDAFVKALEEYINSANYAPHNLINYSPVEVRQSFIGGEVLMAIDWANTGAMSQNAKESIIKDKVGFAKLPGANKVYNFKNKKWEKKYNAPSSISGNWVLIVNKNSKNKDLAFKFVSYMSSKEITGKYVPIGWSGINPSRYSHLKNDNLITWEKNGFSKNSAKAYLNTISEALYNENVLVDLRIPGAHLYYDSFNEYLNKAIKKELGVKEALDLAAKEWNKITQKLGKEEQRRFYKESINE